MFSRAITLLIQVSTVDRITLRQVTSRRRYARPMLAVLADYIAGFRRGARIGKSHEFELVLEKEGA